MKGTKLKVDDFVLGEELGKGSAATVYLGHKVSDSSQFFAVKLVNTGDLKTWEQQAANLVTEARILSHFNHPNIVQLVEHKSDGVLKQNRKILNIKTVYNVIQLGEKGSLLEFLIKGGAFPEPIARHYFRELMEGLYHVHQQGFVHRDIKLDNLLIGANFELLIADFGHAAQTRGLHGDFCLAANPAGTACYNPPETHQAVFSGRPVDVFMAGVVLFIFLTGMRPFSYANCEDLYYGFLMKSDPAGFWKQHKNRQNIALESEAVHLLSSMLDCDPSRRPSVEEVAKHPWVNRQPQASRSDVRAEIRNRRLLYFTDS